MKFTSGIPTNIVTGLAISSTTIYSTSGHTYWASDKIYYSSGMAANTLYTETFSWMQLDNAKVWFYATTSGLIYTNTTRPTAEIASSRVNVATLRSY